MNKIQNIAYTLNSKQHTYDLLAIKIGFYYFTFFGIASETPCQPFGLLNLLTSKKKRINVYRKRRCSQYYIVLEKQRLIFIGVGTVPKTKTLRRILSANNNYTKKKAQF